MSGELTVVQYSTADRDQCRERLCTLLCFVPIFRFGGPGVQKAG